MTKDEKDFGFSLEPPFTMIICGNTGSGKTQLLKHMITNELSKKFDYIFIMCPSLEFSGDYKEFENHKKIKDNMFAEYDQEIINDIMKSQEKIIKKHGKKRCPQTLIILDDCLEYLGFGSLISKIFFKGRHINISCIVLVQKLKGISTLLRINTKYIVFFRTANSKELENLLDEYTGKKERKIIENELNEWFKEKWSFMFCNLKTQDFTKRYALGKDKELKYYLETS